MNKHARTSKHMSSIANPHIDDSTETENNDDEATAVGGRTLYEVYGLLDDLLSLAGTVLVVSDDEGGDAFEDTHPQVKFLNSLKEFRYDMDESVGELVGNEPSTSYSEQKDEIGDGDRITEYEQIDAVRLSEKDSAWYEFIQEQADGDVPDYFVHPKIAIAFQEGDEDELNEALAVLTELYEAAKNDETSVDVSDDDGGSGGIPDPHAESSPDDSDMTKTEAVEEVLRQNEELAEKARNSERNYRSEVVEAVREAFGIDVTTRTVSNAEVPEPSNDGSDESETTPTDPNKGRKEGDVTTTGTDDIEGRVNDLESKMDKILDAVQ